jgi:hypothetical protein
MTWQRCVAVCVCGCVCVCVCVCLCACVWLCVVGMGVVAVQCGVRVCVFVDAAPAGWRRCCSIRCLRT